MLEINVNSAIHQSIPETVSDLKTTEKQVEIAALRALNKTALWLRTQATREISKEKRIPQKLIRERLRVLRASRRGLTAQVKASLYGIRADKLGGLRQTRKAARAGRHTFDGAFVTSVPSGVAGIFKRKGKPRLPIQVQRVSLEPEGSEAIERFLDDRIVGRFDVLFERELTFLVEKI